MLALLFIVVLALPIVADLSPDQRAVMTVVNVAIWAVFVVDYLARLYLALRRWDFVRTHVLDLLVIALLGVVTATIAAWFVGRLHKVQAAEERTRQRWADVLTAS